MFEKVIKIDASLDEMPNWEKVVRIEKPDHEYYPNNVNEIADVLMDVIISHTDKINLREENEKSKSKASKSKPKKNNSKSNVATVANIQEKLQ